MDLTSEHLLYAVLEDNVVRRVLEGAGADPDQIGAQVEEEAQKGARTDVSPSLAPNAKRALLAAYDESQALGTSYIGPEHVLLALAADDESEAGRLLSRFGLSHTRLRGAVVRGVEAGGEAREAASRTPILDENSRDLTQMAREGRLDPVIRRAEEVETTIEILSRRTKRSSTWVEKEILVGCDRYSPTSRLRRPRPTRHGRGRASRLRQGGTTRTTLWSGATVPAGVRSGRG